MSRTTVVSVRGVNGPARAALVADPGFVYVGRNFAGWPGSIFGNPFKGYLAADQFRYQLATALSGCEPSHSAFAGMAARLHELRGKRLGCWCCNWNGTGNPENLCHAVVLAQMADALEETNQ